MSTRRENLPPSERLKGRSEAGQGDAAARLRRLASAIALAVALVLIVAKLWGWFATGSLVLLTSAADAFVDAAASLATFIGVRYAERPADPVHRFGHGKGEAVAAFTQALLLAGAGIVLAANSAWHLIFPEALTDLHLGLWIATGGLVTAGFLAAMQSWVARRTRSTAIAADKAHYVADVAVNVAVLAALGVTQATGLLRADAAFALVIAAYMLWNARGMAARALVQLLDQELPHEQRQCISQAALACAGARAIHDLRTRNAGDRVFVEFHLEVDGRLSIRQGHDIVDAAENAVAALFPHGIEVIGHLEPAGIDDERLDDRVHSAEAT